MRLGTVAAIAFGALALALAPAASADLGLPGLPVELAPPTIAGVAAQGQTLTCSNGSWLGDPTSFAYSWQRNGADIVGATGSAYTLTVADVSQSITCAVSAANGLGVSLPVPSAATVPAGLPLLGAPADTVLPMIAGATQVGQTASCSPGSWTGSPTSYVYSWQRDGTDIAGATGSTYTLAAADTGQAVTCTVAAANGLGLGARAISLPILPVTPPGLPVPLDTTLPAIAGSPQLGQTVTCSPGTWTGDPTSFVYSWQRSGATISGAVGSTYTLASQDVGQSITCAVSAANGAGSSLPVGSLPVVPLGASSLPVPVATSPPTISGNPALGQNLTCSSGSWSNAPTSYTYAWQRTGAILSGATGSTYVATASDLAQAISCIVVAHNASGDSAPAFSLPVVPVAGGGGGGGGGKPGSGGGKPKAPKLLAPTVKSLSVSPRKMMITVKGKRQTTRGATFRFAIDKPAGVLIYVERRTVGRVNGRSCAATTKRNAHARHCTRYVRVKAFTVKNAKAGGHTVKYGGRQGRGLVASGNYTVFAAAQNSAGWSRLRTASFAVARKQIRPPARRPSKHRK
jgi:hypothetical protein